MDATLHKILRGVDTPTVCNAIEVGHGRRGYDRFATVHRAFGIAGVLTNGLARDLGDLPEGFSIVAGGIGPSHAFVRMLDFDRRCTSWASTARPTS